MLRALILASLCAVISASIIPSYIFDYPRSLQHLFSSKRAIAAENKKGEREVCKTKECELIAQVIKDSMDESLDPCEDFYEYACGKWSDVNQIPENMSDWSLWTMVSKKVERQVEEIIESKPAPDDLFALKLAKKWYHSCMDTDAIERKGVEPILSTLWRHGGWPLIMEDGEWDENVYNWQIVDDHFARLLGFNAFHDLRYSRLSYEDNDTLLIDTPHLPPGAYQILSHEKYYNTDSSDENNESGEGSQEKGSKERGQEQENSNNEDEETMEDEETEEDGDLEDEGDRKIAIARKHKRLGHSGSRNRKSKVTTSHIGKTRRRSRRDVLKRKVLHRKLHQLKKTKKHKIHHSTKGKLSQNAHLSHKKLSAKKHNLENRKIEKHSNAKVTNSKRNNKRKRIGKNDEEENERQRKKKVERSKTAKRLGKHAHERKLKKKLNRIESRAKVQTSKHQSHQKITTNKLHHVNNKVVLNHKKMHLADSTEDAGSEINTSDDDDNDEKDENNNDASNNGDDEDEEENENDSDNNDGQEDEEESSDNGENDDEDNEDDGNDDDDDDDDENDDDEDSDNDDDDEEEREAKRQEMIQTYREHILNVSIILSKGRDIEISVEQMMQDIDDLVEFTIKLGELTFIDADPATMTLKEFQEYYTELGPPKPKTKVNWARKVEKLLAEAGIDIDNDVDITVVSPEYIEKLRALLEETPSKVLVNYIHWLFVSKAIMAGTEELWNLSTTWSGSFNFPSRESACIEMVQLTRVAGYEYVKRYFSKDVAQSARDMIDDIQKEVEYQIKSSTWMDHDTKHFILDKLVHMKNWVGYPEWYQNTTLVKRYFRGLTVGPSFYENLLNYVRYARWRNLREMIDTDTDDVGEMLDPLELNAFFMPTENSISITAVDFQSPFFAHSRPWYVNFGIIGLVMGHEVNHGFDDSGHLYDKEGNEMEWLSAMAEAYNQRAECFVDQYNNYSIIKGENFTVDNYGNQTAGENIADTMGLLAVFRAYKRRERECGKPDPALPGLEKFTNDQTFFLSFANLWCEAIDREHTIMSAKYDVHSTGRLRVIGPASNSPDFAKAFNCPVGSPMNPKKKCDIWQ